MQNLKINGTPTPYWCVVVGKNTFDFTVRPQMVEYWRGLKDKHEYWSTGEIILPDGNWELLGCITLSSMEEGVKEVCDLIRFNSFLESAIWILTHNQITLTTETKAVVVKQKL